MLVLSRKVNQAFIVNESLKVTLSRIHDGAVELSWGSQRANLSNDESVEVIRGVQFRLVRVGKHQARFSIDASREITIHRDEIHERIQQERALAS